MGFGHLESIDISEEILIIDALISLNLVKSKREAREMIKNNAVSVNGLKINDLNFIIKKENAFGKKYTIIRKGKTLRYD